MESRLDMPAETASNRVVVVAPSGEVDGVEDGTTGEFLGALLDLSGKPRVAIRLDDNGETVYVRPQSVRVL